MAASIRSFAKPGHILHDGRPCLQRHTQHGVRRRWRRSFARHQRHMARTVPNRHRSTSYNPLQLHPAKRNSKPRLNMSSATLRHDRRQHDRRHHITGYASSFRHVHNEKHAAAEQWPKHRHIHRLALPIRWTGTKPAERHVLAAEGSQPLRKRNLQRLG